VAAGTATGGTHSMGSASGGHPQVELATHPRTRSTLHKALYCQGYRGYLLPTVACGSEAAPSPTREDRESRTDARSTSAWTFAPCTWKRLSAPLSWRRFRCDTWFVPCAVQHSLQSCPAYAQCVGAAGRL